MTTSNIEVGKSTQKSNLAIALAPGAARRRFVFNVASNIAYIALSTAIMLWYTPFLILNLGIAAYGMVPLANSLVNFVTILADGLNVAINRYLVIDLNQLDERVANRTFNTAFLTSILLVCLLLPFGIAVAWLFPIFFLVPAGLENQSRLLFGGVVLTNCLAIIGSGFSVSSMALHRFDLRNIIRGLTIITRSGLVVLLFALVPEQLSYIAVGYVIAALVSISGDWYLWRKLTPQLRINFLAFDKSRMKEMASLGFWAVVNQLGALLLLSFDLIIVNFFFGPETTGRYGTILIFAALIHTLTDAAATVLSPAIAGYYARKDFSGLRQIASQASRLMGLGLAIPIGLLCGFGKPLLGLWLGPEFQDLNILLIVLIGHLSINLATRPLLYVLTSYNKVRVQGIVTLILGITNICLACGFAYWGGWGVVGVAVAGAIIWTIKNLVFMSGYSARIMNLPWPTFFVPLVAGAVGMAGIGVTGYTISQIWQPQSWLLLGTMSIGVVSIYLPIAYSLLLKQEDRSLITSLVLTPFLRLLRQSN
jgi:membrane protein EpsK